MGDFPTLNSKYSIDISAAPLMVYVCKIGSIKGLNWGNLIQFSTFVFSLDSRIAHKFD